MLLEWHTGYVPVRQAFWPDECQARKPDVRMGVRRYGEISAKLVLSRISSGRSKKFGSLVSYRGQASVTIADSGADRTQAVENGIV